MIKLAVDENLVSRIRDVLNIAFNNSKDTYDGDAKAKSDLVNYLLNCDDALYISAMVGQINKSTKKTDIPLQVPMDVTVVPTVEYTNVNDAVYLGLELTFTVPDMATLGKEYIDAIEYTVYSRNNNKQTILRKRINPEYTAPHKRLDISYIITIGKIQLYEGFKPIYADDEYILHQKMHDPYTVEIIGGVDND